MGPNPIWLMPLEEEEIWQICPQRQREDHKRHREKVAICEPRREKPQKKLSLLTPWSLTLIFDFQSLGLQSSEQFLLFKFPVVLCYDSPKSLTHSCTLGVHNCVWFPLHLLGQGLTSWQVAESGFEPGSVWFWGLPRMTKLHQTEARGKGSHWLTGSLKVPSNINSLWSGTPGRLRHNFSRLWCLSYS